jgi:hypothetical protein
MLRRGINDLGDMGVNIVDHLCKIEFSEKQEQMIPKAVWLAIQKVTSESFLCQCMCATLFFSNIFSAAYFAAVRDKVIVNADNDKEFMDFVGEDLSEKQCEGMCDFFHNLTKAVRDNNNAIVVKLTENRPFSYAFLVIASLACMNLEEVGVDENVELVPFMEDVRRDPSVSGSNVLHAMAIMLLGVVQQKVRKLEECFH